WKGVSRALPCNSIGLLEVRVARTLKSQGARPDERGWELQLALVGLVVRVLGFLGGLVLQLLRHVVLDRRGLNGFVRHLLDRHRTSQGMLILLSLFSGCVGSAHGIPPGQAPRVTPGAPRPCRPDGAEGSRQPSPTRIMSS